MKKKRGLKIITVRIQRRKLPRFCSPLKPSDASLSHGDCEALVMQKYRRSLLFYSSYDSGTAQCMYFVLLTLLTYVCNFSKCCLKLELLTAASNYTKAFLVNYIYIYANRKLDMVELFPTTSVERIQ